ncbi:hypothetical protein EJ110_NYTH04002 [Nymphaea thermarum]|nr:hypothetical protein EJ110_NYTH04002 [Nymphaea thermarum]
MVDPECRNPDEASTPRQKVCRAGNASCSARSFPPTVDCDVCCAEPSFCRDCCCILCGSPVDFSLGSSCFIRCEARSLGGGAAGAVCGHVSHVRCTIASRLGGSVESVGVDVGYYCRRCDQRTDLVAHVYNVLRSCQVSGSSDGVEECLGLCLGLLQGAKWFGAMAWAAGIQSALRKLKEGRPLIEVWDLEDRCRTPIAGKVEPDAEQSCATPEKPKRKIQHGRGAIEQQGSSLHASGLSIESSGYCHTPSIQASVFWAANSDKCDIQIKFKVLKQARSLEAEVLGILSPEMVFSK